MVGNVDNSINNVNTSISGIGGSNELLTNNDNKLDTLDTSVNTVNSSLSGIGGVNDNLGSVKSSIDTNNYWNPLMDNVR